MTLQIFTANRVSDGVVVYLTEDGRWLESVFLGSVISNGDGLALMTAEAEAAARDSIVIEPFLIDVTREGDRVRPVRYRERIRAFGPTTHPEFAKPSAAKAA